MEVAAGRRIGGVRDLAGERHVAAGRVGIRDGHGPHQRGGVRMTRMPEDLLGGGELDELSHVHHRDSIADVLHHGKIVGHEEQGQVAGAVWSSRRRFSTCACTETSSADTGSSATTRRGSVASARAMPMRWR